MKLGSVSTQDCNAWADLEPSLVRPGLTDADSESLLFLIVPVGPSFHAPECGPGRKAFDNIRSYSRKAFGSQWKNWQIRGRD